MLVTIGLVIFRAENIGQFLEYFSGVFDFSLPSLDDFKGIGMRSATTPIVFALVLFVIEWIYKDSEYPLAQLGVKWKKPIKLAFYYAIILAIFYFGGEEQQFIYFQF